MSLTVSASRFAHSTELESVMAKFKFPKNPGADRENPFEDKDGVNPFCEGTTQQEQGTTEQAEESNPYASAESNAVQPYQPGDYETFLPNRGTLVCTLGIVGFLIQLIAIAVAVIAVVAVGDSLEGIAYGLPGQLIGLAVCIPGWIMGHSDVRAIDAGAMEEGGLRATRWGLRLGVVGTLLGAGQLFLYFGLLFFAEFYA